MSSLYRKLAYKNKTLYVIFHPILTIKLVIAVWKLVSDELKGDK